MKFFISFLFFISKPQEEPKLNSHKVSYFVLSKFSILLFTSLLWSTTLLSQVIPNQRKIKWNPGIPNGIPTVNSSIANIIDYGADPTGKIDSKQAFLDAIKSIPKEGGIVYIPEGNFLLCSTLKIDRDNILIKGASEIKSKVFTNFNGNCFEIIKYKRGDWQILDTIKKDLRTITVPLGSKFTVGDFAEIQQDNDPKIMYTNDEWNVPWAKNSVGQLFEIEKINGNQLTLKTPIHFKFNLALTPSIRPQDLIKNVGFENFYVESKISGKYTFLFKNAAYCWITKVESYKTLKSHVNFNTAIGCEIRDSYFHHSFSYGNGGKGYGVRCGYHTTDVLIENNIFDSLRHSMMVSLGSNGNVFGYNYSINNIQGDDKANLNDGWIPPDISIHGHYSYMNLFEGNDVMEIGIGDYWGPSGIGNTFFRNRVNDEGIIYYDHSNSQNIVGNITNILKDSDSTSTKKLEHGNKINGVIYWNDTISNHQLINSYYKNGKPLYFKDENWPPFGPNSDLINKLPAQIRFEGIKTSNKKELISTLNLNLKVFPNPSGNYINIEICCLKGKNNIKIVNLKGKIVFEDVLFVKNSSFKNRIQFKNLLKGIYFLKIINSNSIAIKKFIIE